MMLYTDTQKYLGTFQTLYKHPLDAQTPAMTSA